MTTNINSLIATATTQEELFTLIEENFDLPKEESWGETASRWEAEGHPDKVISVLRAAEARWFELA